MALQITETRNVFSVHGNLTSGNVDILSRHMQMFMGPNKKIVLNLGKVNEIDETAAHRLQHLFLGAVRSKILFTIIGMENRKVTSIMEKTKTSYILNDDRD